MKHRTFLSLLAIGALAATTACSPAASTTPADQTQAATALVGAPQAAPKPVKGASPDFDGDGKADLAVSESPDEPSTLKLWYGSGATATIEGGDVGGPPVTRWERGIDGPLLAADFDGDGYDDIAFERGLEDGSALLVQIFGSPTGLDLSRKHNVALPHAAGTDISVRSLALIDAPTPRLAVGVSVSTEKTRSARVQVFDLDDSGMAESTPLVLRLGSGGMPKLTDWKGGSFGDALASSGNRLFIGVPYAKVKGTLYAGAVLDVTMGAAGVTKTRTVTQATAGVAGAPGKTDTFGSSLDAGDGYLVVGTPRDDVEGVRTTGSVQIFKVTPTKLTPVKRISQAGSVVPGKAERGDLFGWSVELGRHCANVTSVIVGGIGEGIAKGHTDDGAVWLIPLTKAKGCKAIQLYEGHGLSGKPHWAYLGEYVAALRDANSSTDTFAFAGGGSFSEGPIGELFRWSPVRGETFRIDGWLTGVAGRR